jgi:hypothetical protein
MAIILLKVFGVAGIAKASNFLVYTEYFVKIIEKRSNNNA